jgi:hypothetical protein
MERSLKRRAAATAAAFALVTGAAALAGCGSSGSDTTASTAASDAAAQSPNGVEKLPAKEILTKSQAAAKAASSVTVTGTISDGGEETSVDLVLGADASEGTFTTNGVELSIVIVDGKSYFKVPGDGWATLLGSGGPEGTAAGEAIASQVGDNWLMLPADPESLDEAGGLLGTLLGTFGSLFQKDGFLEATLAPDGGATVTGTGDANGTPVVFLEDTTGEGTLAIQTVGEPYPVQVKGDGAEGAGEISFTNWNAPVNVTAPTEVLDIGQLTERSAARF